MMLKTLINKEIKKENDNDHNKNNDNSTNNNNNYNNDINNNENNDFYLLLQRSNQLDAEVNLLDKIESENNSYYSKFHEFTNYESENINGFEFHRFEDGDGREEDGHTCVFSNSDRCTQRKLARRAVGREWGLRHQSPISPAHLRIPSFFSTPRHNAVNASPAAESTA